MRTQLEFLCNMVKGVLWSLIMVMWITQGESQVEVGDPQAVMSLVNSGLVNVSNFMSSQLEKQAPFCVSDGREDWDRAFNYTDVRFLTDCMKDSPDIAQRLCTAAEVKLYMSNYLTKRGSDGGPNKNCNASSSSWVPGCEPGWACRTAANVDVDLKNSKEIPTRTANCKSCCAGFFCPRGLTCMLPCPLGASCPLAKFNNQTGLCDPYNYQLPPGGNHTCGAANVWADVVSSKEVFCPAGSYCPSTTEKIQCDSGYYCRVGSTEQTRCSKLISCDAGTASQNIRTYGIMVIIALVALLLLIYNCSDQILALRDRRRATSRDSAAHSVQQRERALARWKIAKEAAKRHASGLQATLSRRFSHRGQSDRVKVLNENDIEADHSLLSTHHFSSDISPQLESDGEPNDCSNAKEKTDMGSRNGKGLALEIEEKATKKKMPKSKETETQIFKNAFTQIEKEKSEEMHYENITLSRVISMATCSTIRKRPLIEIAFKDLTLTLKGKKKCLLKSLTGRIAPGRIAAVMGPSGAGKTTFLSALAGKATGCNRTGSIFINGQPRSILSYRKIVGFVPQDDIVHGNLTVEENLWFSANCRLSANLPRAEKVLIVERVIANLGLQEVRDSLVGTVEKRGISGGQRKRVNVGLEMVMEPSLVFLDEPTSGLDSSSSRLLLRALKHEAHAGVNICMVVHQPSYALFKMFDDLILLAKGGLMVYNGSVRMVEDYFGGLGIHVPGRINPPDYYIDILEGLVEPSTSSGVNYKELPLRWMLHNGYPVPEDMQSTAATLGMSTSGESTHHGSEQSFAGELWQDVRCHVELRRDHIRRFFLKGSDLSNRRTPGVILQYRYFLGRICKQKLREASLQATDYLILLVAGACVGAITKINDADFGAIGYSYTVIAMSLLCQIAALRSFSLDKLQYWRESASGMSSLAYFLAKDTVDHFNTLIKPVVYLSMFYFFTNPRSSFFDNYVVLVFLVYCVTGMGYAFAIFFNPGPAQLFSVLLPVCLTLISTQSFNNTGLQPIANLCYPKWALEAFVVSNAERYYGVWLITRCGALYKLNFSLHLWKYCILILLMFGVVSRAIAFIGLLIIQKR